MNGLARLALRSVTAAALFAFALAHLGLGRVGAARAQTPEPAPPAPAAPRVTEPQVTEPRWYERVKVAAFVDAYASFNALLPRTGGLVAPSRFRAYDVQQGFALHWVGLDAIVEPEPVGGTVSLRYGPSVAIYTGQPDLSLGLGNVKQAFATFRPGGADGKLTLALGKFDTIYGAEVADSQLNVTYTRSMLNYFGQPFFHTGLRADWELSDVFQLRFLAVNGWNNAWDNNLGKTVGVQANWKPIPSSDALLVAVGWLGGPEQADSVTVACDADTAYAAGACAPAPGAEASETVLAYGSNNRRFRHIVDAIVDWTPTARFRVLLNGDFATEEVQAFGASSSARKTWYGVDATLRETLGSAVFLGVRGSWFRDRNGYLTGTDVDTRVTSGTLTLGITPVPGLVAKLEPRVDVANEPFFQRRAADASKVQFTTTLGVVVTTD